MNYTYCATCGCEFVNEEGVDSGVCCGAPGEASYCSACCPEHGDEAKQIRAQAIANAQAVAQAHAAKLREIAKETERMIEEARAKMEKEQVIAEAHAKIAADTAEDQRLLDLVAKHSDRTTKKGRE